MKWVVEFIDENSEEWNKAQTFGVDEMSNLKSKKGEVPTMEIKKTKFCVEYILWIFNFTSSEMSSRIYWREQWRMWWSKENEKEGGAKEKGRDEWEKKSGEEKRKKILEEENERKWEMRRTKKEVRLEEVLEMKNDWERREPEDNLKTEDGPTKDDHVKLINHEKM